MVRYEGQVGDLEEKKSPVDVWFLFLPHIDGIGCASKDFSNDDIKPARFGEIVSWAFSIGIDVQINKFITLPSYIQWILMQNVCNQGRCQ